MMPAAGDNPAGFWESMRIVTANQMLLLELGYNWYDCMPFDPTQFSAELRLAIQPQLETLLREEFGAAPLCVIKDPRLCLLLDVWGPALAGSAALLAVRHPAEVAGSLLRRDRCPAEVAFPLWLHYTLEAEHQSRPYRRSVIFYDRFLQDWRGTMVRAGEQAGIAWTRRPGAVTEDDTRFVQAKYRHHFAAPGRIAVGVPPVRGWMAETWNLLRECEADGFDPSRLRALDQVRTAFAAWRRTSGPRVAVVPQT
jgi:hypothetical protein